MDKRFNYRVFDSDDNFLATWNDVSSSPSFSQEINSAGSELKVLLARDPNNLGTDVDFNNKVIVTVHDKETPEGRNLFQGFISEYKPKFKENEIFTEITLLGFGADLAGFVAEIFDTDSAEIKDFAPDGGSTTFAYNAGQDNISFRFRANYESIKRLHLYTDIAQAMENFDLVEDDAGIPSSTSVLPSGTSIELSAQTLISAAPDTYDNNFLFPFGVMLEIGKFYHFVISPGSGGTPEIFHNVTNLDDDTSWLFNDNGIGYVLQGGDLNYKLEPAFLNTTITFTDTDPSEMLRSILDIYIFRGGKINYDGASLEPTLTFTTYTFKVASILDVINKVLQLSPADFYWYIDQANNIIHLKRAETDFEHRFIYGKNLKINEINAISQDIVNTVYFTGAEISAGVNFYKKFTDQNLIDRFGVKSVVISDNRVSLTATADKLANRVLAENSSPTMRTSIEVVDSNVADTPEGFDIETIVVGDIVSFGNIGQSRNSRWGQAKWDVDKWGMDFKDIGTIILQVGRLIYNPGSVIIEAKDLPVNVYQQIAGQGGSIGKIETVNNPDSPD